MMVVALICLAEKYRANRMQHCRPEIGSSVDMSTGKTGWKDSCVDSTMGEMAAYIHGNQGVLAERLAEHETLL